MIIKRIGAISLAKILGAAYAAIGLLFGLLASLFSLLGAGLMGQASGGMGLFSLLTGGLSFIVFPVFYGVIGFVTGLISALIYNLFSKSVGGVELEIG